MAFFGLGGGTSAGGLTNKGASREMPSIDQNRDQGRGRNWERNRQVPQQPQAQVADQGFYQAADPAGKAALLQAMIARSRAGYGA